MVWYFSVLKFEGPCATLDGTLLGKDNKQRMAVRFSIFYKYEEQEKSVIFSKKLTNDLDH